MKRDAELADCHFARKKLTTFYPFPLGPGPFELNSTQRKVEDAVPNVHEAADVTPDSCSPNEEKGQIHTKL